MGKSGRDVLEDLVAVKSLVEVRSIGVALGFAFGFVLAPSNAAVGHGAAAAVAAGSERDMPSRARVCSRDS